MRKTLIAVGLLCTISCTSSQYKDGVLAKDGIPIDKAHEVVAAYFATVENINFNGEEVQVESCKEHEKIACEQDVYLLKAQGEFCRCDYRISHSKYPNCLGWSVAIESCSNGQCNYRFSEFLQVCH